MAIFRCMNCGILIKKKVIHDPYRFPHEYGEVIKCPKCGSMWVEYYCPDVDVEIRSPIVPADKILISLDDGGESNG